MRLPCPHCKRQFTFAVEQIKTETAKLKCPTCEGLFVIQLSPGVAPGEEGDDPSVSASVPEQLPGEAEKQSSKPSASGNMTDSLEITEDLFDGGEAYRQGPLSLIRRAISPRYLYAMLALTSLFLLIFLLSIGSSGRHPPPATEATQAPMGVENPEAPAATPAAEISVPADPATQEAVASPADPTAQQEDSAAASSDPLARDPMSLAFWSYGSADSTDPCAILSQLEEDALVSDDQDFCQVYPKWIAYLVLEAATKPACEVEPTFGIAKEAVKDNSLCGEGYAFLSAYYIHKKIIGQSHEFLEKALEASPDSPWVKLVEALFYEKIRNDRGKALSSLKELNKQVPGFSLARYLLAKTYIKREEYKMADTVFMFLQEEYAEQDAFGRIQKALASIDGAPYYSTVKAQGLLSLSRDFAELKDRPMAEHLCRKVLEEMSGRLPENDRKAAYCELGRIYESRGDKSSAYDSYRNALKIDPQFQDARERLDRLL